MKTEGLNVFSILFIVFLVLKLTNNIDWSWWWVTAPLWIPASIVLLVIGVAGLVAVIAKIINAMFEE